MTVLYYIYLLIVWKRCDVKPFHPAWNQLVFCETQSFWRVWDSPFKRDFKHTKSFYYMDNRAFCNPTNRKNSLHQRDGVISCATCALPWPLRHQYYSRITVSNNDTGHSIWAGYRRAMVVFLPTAVFPPPLRGSNINIVFTVSYVRIANFTNGYVPFATTRL